MKPEKVIILGNGMVGCRFAEKLSELNKEDPRFSISVFGEEPQPAYDRVHLSAFFEKGDSDKLILKAQSWYAERGIALFLGNKITSVDTAQKTVKDENGVVHTYDRLVFASGSSAFVPSIPGIEAKGVFTYRTIRDLKAIYEYARGKKTGGILGGGLLGLEAGKALLDMQLSAHVIEFAPRIMPRQLDETASQFLQQKIERMGVTIHTSRVTRRIVEFDGKISGIEFEDATTIPLDILIVSAGIRPRDEIAKVSGIQTGNRGGIVVDDFLQTSAPAVYAIGECALHNEKIYGLVTPGYEMAEILAQNFFGGRQRFLGADMSTKLKLIGVDVASIGDALGEISGSRSVVIADEQAGFYKRINISDDGKNLTGAILVGDNSDYGMLYHTMISRMQLPANPREIIMPASEGKKMELPDSAVVCSCNNVTKGVIRNAIADHDIEDIDSIKNVTNAGTGCGGCVPELGNILRTCLRESGKEVKKNICEHFSFSRNELYDIITVKGHRTFNEVIEEHGNGNGCEICKPAIASILAGIYNEPAVKHANIQDTNDRFLANIQKNGTYSVVPRIPGGEITPEKLMVIGKIAMDFDLYVKITGGQRIDMFGAHLGDLPVIWERLISAGFESGHAYAKSLRTVKSCVGSTWCRYGVQDSVSLAIRIENRYKGLRGPHKIKGAVTGCLRQCAEVDNKDFGLIATEKGYNLYVAGNGGAKPQSAVLLASDIDEDTAIKYIDRFLLYYIRTAAPLTRTASWFNNLEGGIESLRNVIISDSLGICSDLEKQMQYLIENYECEWKAALSDPGKRSQFSHFANSSEKDSSIVFVNDRGQKVPRMAMDLLGV